MDVRIFIFVIASLCAVSFSNGQPLPLDVREGARNQFIPGVFISSESLKNLQDRAQQQKLGHENQGNSGPLVSSLVTQDSSVKVNPPSVDNQRIESVKPVLVNQQAIPIQQAIVANQQPILANQESILANQRPILANQQPILANQQTLGARLISTQPVTANEQLQQQLSLQQSPLSIQQPGQPMLVNQANLPNQQAIYVTQPGLNNQQPLLISQQPGQTILLNQQPGLAGQQATFVSQQPNLGQQLVLQNGQVAQIAYQQPTIAQKPIQNPSTLYAVVSNVPNQGVSKVNSYLVPVQQLQQASNTVAINGK